MAYTEEQKKEHIYELQQYLYAISLFDDRIPRVVPGGEYTPETAEAVRAFQQAYGLPQTGEADSDTWDMIVLVYRDITRISPFPYAAFPSKDYVSHEGDHGGLVYIIQTMLSGLFSAYDNMPKLEICGSYDVSTAEAVKALQKKTGLPESGEVNCTTWNVLVKLCEA